MKLKVFSVLFISLLNLSAFEFGYMGNESFGMGGSGVAVSKSAWGLYYNPAMQGVDNNFKIGYSFGIRIKENRISDLSNINLSNISSVDLLNDILTNNGLSMTSENGIALQVPLILTENISSSIGVGVFYTKRSVINFTGNINAGTTNIDNVNNAYIVTNRLDILEIPVSYTMQIYSGFGTFYLGGNLKYIYSGHSADKNKLDSGVAVMDSFKDIFKSGSGVKTNTFGVDVGLAYAAPMEYIVIGIVAKNLNNPKLKTIDLGESQNLKLDSQYRIGISTRIIPLTTIALDADLKPNYEFSGFNTNISRNKVQYVSLGAMVNAGVVDIRFGFAKDILKNNNEGWLISGGLGFGFIDLSVFSDTKLIKVNNSKIPSEFGVKLGGSFSF
ncbi:conjugal transfer protein TraF [Helicobacter sp. MIT 14-3879]|uniref:conjugal transfer protein TraF n=1 Tax=Helicobacter sp. MIT 14-3879 TaxID=2040649 RepID=UPI0015F1B413|nr:conjugal transfer protein TraF [Helicobacter sp. MIT 14-3879]